MKVYIFLVIKILTVYFGYNYDICTYLLPFEWQTLYSPHYKPSTFPTSVPKAKPSIRLFCFWSRKNGDKTIYQLTLSIIHKARGIFFYLL